MSEDYKLCYVDDRYRYFVFCFTTYDLPTITRKGKGWHQQPYEKRAQPPTSAETSLLFTVYGNLEVAHEIYQQPLSVDMINGNGFIWARHRQNKTSIFPGANMCLFLEFVISTNSHVELMG